MEKEGDSPQTLQGANWGREVCNQFYWAILLGSSMALVQRRNGQQLLNTCIVQCMYVLRLWVYSLL
jgi:hypothetical protein